MKDERVGQTQLLSVVFGFHKLIQLKGRKVYFLLSLEFDIDLCTMRNLLKGPHRGQYKLKNPDDIDRNLYPDISEFSVVCTTKSDIKSSLNWFCQLKQSPTFRIIKLVKFSAKHYDISRRKTICHFIV